MSAGFLTHVTGKQAEVRAKFSKTVVSLNAVFFGISGFWAGIWDLYPFWDLHPHLLSRGTYINLWEDLGTVFNGVREEEVRQEPQRVRGVRERERKKKKNTKKRERKEKKRKKESIRINQHGSCQDSPLYRMQPILRLHLKET